MLHVMIVQSPYYADIAKQLLAGAVAVLEEKHMTYEIFEVAGALEIPTAIKLGSLRNPGKGVEPLKFDAYLALGCVLRGETSHYDIVCNESAHGLTKLAIEYDLIIGNAILTCETMEQAVVRADPAQMNKGADAVAAILSLLEAKRKMRLVHND